MGWLDQNGQITTLIEISNQFSVDDCKTVCLTYSGCVGFTFVGFLSRCDLKNDFQAATLQSYPDHLGLIAGRLQGKLTQAYIYLSIQNA